MDFEETVLIQSEASKGRKRRQREGEESEKGKAAPEDIMHPVLCEVCETKLGLFDSDEVFHFFGVLASEP